MPVVSGLLSTGETFVDFQSLANIPKRIEVLNMTLTDLAIIGAASLTSLHEVFVPVDLLVFKSRRSCKTSLGLVTWISNFVSHGVM